MTLEAINSKVPPPSDSLALFFSPFLCNNGEGHELGTEENIPATYFSFPLWEESPKDPKNESKAHPGSNPLKSRHWNLFWFQEGRNSSISGSKGGGMPKGSPEDLTDLAAHDPKNSDQLRCRSPIYCSDAPSLRPRVYFTTWKGWGMMRGSEDPEY